MSVVRECSDHPKGEGPSDFVGEWREVYDAMHEGETFPLDYDTPAGVRLADLETKIGKGPIRYAQDALAKLRLWLAFRHDSIDMEDGKVEPGTPCKTTGEMEREALEHGSGFDDDDHYTASVFTWLHAICEEGK